MVPAGRTVLGRRGEGVRLLSRYVVVGAVNTACGYLVIFAFMYGAGWSPEASNVIGYAIGLVTSFALNRRFTFESSGPRAREFARFLGTFAVAFLANFAVLALMVRALELHAGGLADRGGGGLRRRLRSC